MSEAELNVYKMATAARKRKSRKSQRQTECASSPSPADMEETPLKPYQLPQPYKRPQSLGKALTRSMRSLPESPRKRKAIIHGLAERFGIPLEIKMERALSEMAGNSGVPEELKQAVYTFYLRSDISFTMPGLKDEMTVWRDGKKERLRKHYLTLFLREAFALFKELHPGIILGRSTFCRLRPDNVLLLKDTPKDQCKCRIHENFRMKLKGLRIDYEKDWWHPFICNDGNLQSSCWIGKCDVCKEGKLLQAKLSSELDMSKATYWHQWKKDDSKVLRKLTQTGCCGELLKDVLDSIPEVQEHVRVKRIQSEAFEMLKEDNRILQIDFAMAYSCEYQAEVQSALWSRASVTLFRAAAFYKDTTKTYLICSNTKDKGKDTVYTFVNRLYEHIMQDLPTAGNAGDIIFSDGPSSEFKNKFCMKVLYDLSQKYQKDFSWKYFATSHGKGVVDGVGGRAKSLVRQKSMSQDQVNIVQSSKDFADLAKRLMSATRVFHIDQDEINAAVDHLDSWKDIPAADGIRNMHDAICLFKDHRIRLRHVSGQPSSDFVIAYRHELDAEDVLQLETPAQHNPPPVDVVAGDWVAVIYDDQWWPGTVDSVAHDTQTLRVSFMKPVGNNKFIWRHDSDGKTIDTEAVPRNEVLSVLTERPIPVSNRHFTFPLLYARSLDELMKTV